DPLGPDSGDQGRALHGGPPAAAQQLREGHPSAPRLQVTARRLRGAPSGRAHRPSRLELPQQGPQGSAARGQGRRLSEARQPVLVEDNDDRFVVTDRPPSGAFGATSPRKGGRKRKVGDADGDDLPGGGHRSTPKVQSSAHQTSTTAARLRAPIRTGASGEAVARNTPTIMDRVSTGRTANLGTQPAAEATKGAM